MTSLSHDGLLSYCCTVDALADNDPDAYYASRLWIKTSQSCGAWNATGIL
jgi:hypothetical protein